MVTKRDDDETDDDQPGEYRAICLGKVGRQSFAICNDKPGYKGCKIGFANLGNISSLN